MKIEIKFAFCALVVLTGSSQTKGQNSPTTTTTLTAVDLSSEAGLASVTPVSSESPTDAVEDELEHDSSDNPSYQTSEHQDGTTATSMVVTGGHVTGQSQTGTADRNGTTTTTRMSTADSAVRTTAPSVISLSDFPASASMPPDVETSTPLKYISTTDSSDTPTQGTELQLQTTSATPSLMPPPQDITTPQTSTHASTEAPTQTNTRLPTTSQPQASAPAYPPASQPRQEGPSELNVGDDDFKGPRQHRSSPLDPLLAGLVSVFIVTTAIISVVLFLKFRQRTEHPEFHRLQDLPMDDLLEDTPLSRYSY